jgi:hypothetical protein
MRIPSRPFVVVAVAVSLSVLAGCDGGFPIADEDEVSFDGEVVMPDASLVAVSGSVEYPTTTLVDDHLDGSFYVARPDEPGIIVSMTTDLVVGTFIDRDVPMHVCSCHLLPDREDPDLTPSCDDDEERVCVELTGTMSGTYAKEDCDDEFCLSNLYATFTIPSGFEFEGRVSFVHEETWGYNQELL